MFCHKCGTENNDGNAYCKKCGAPLKKYKVFTQENSTEVPAVGIPEESHAETVSSFPVPQPVKPQPAAAQYEEENQSLQDEQESVRSESKGNVVIIVAIVFVVLLGTYLLFAYKMQKWPFSGSDEMIEEEVGIEAIVEEQVRNGLFNAIPDHELDKGVSYGYMTEELYDLLKEAYDVPQSPIGEIGDEEFLYYFVSGNDGGTVTVDNVKVFMSDTTHSTAMVETNMGAHSLKLVKKGNQWLLEDFDDQKRAVKEYVDKQRDYFSSGRYMEESNGSEEWNWYETAVKAHMKKYGIPENERNIEAGVVASDDNGHMGFLDGSNYLEGNMIDKNGKKYPFTLSFNYQSAINELSDIVYLNVNSGTKINMTKFSFEDGKLKLTGIDNKKDFILLFSGQGNYIGDAWWGDFHHEIELRLK